MQPLFLVFVLYFSLCKCNISFIKNTLIDADRDSAVHERIIIPNVQEARSKKRDQRRTIANETVGLDRLPFVEYSVCSRDRRPKPEYLWDQHLVSYMHTSILRRVLADETKSPLNQILWSIWRSASLLSASRTVGQDGCMKGNVDWEILYIYSWKL